MAWRLEGAAEKLRAGLVDMRFAKPLDDEAIVRAAEESDLLVTAEEGIIAGGAGDGVLETLAAKGIEVPVLEVGVPDVIPSHGSLDALLRDCGMDEDSVVRRVGEKLLAIGGAVRYKE